MSCEAQLEGSSHKLASIDAASDVGKARVQCRAGWSKRLDRCCNEPKDQEGGYKAAGMWEGYAGEERNGRRVTKVFCTKLSMSL